jgi:hypothetical protein
LCQTLAAGQRLPRALIVNVRDSHSVKNRPLLTRSASTSKALGRFSGCDSRKTEGAKFWLQILGERQPREGTSTVS